MRENPYQAPVGPVIHRKTAPLRTLWQAVGWLAVVAVTLTVAMLAFSPQFDSPDRFPKPEEAGLAFSRAADRNWLFLFAARAWLLTFLALLMAATSTLVTWALNFLAGYD